MQQFFRNMISADRKLAQKYEILDVNRIGYYIDKAQSDNRVELIIDFYRELDCYANDAFYEKMVKLLNAVNSSSIDMALYEEILKEYQNRKFDVCSVWRWKALSVFANGNGLFRLGLVCRLKAKELVKKQFFSKSSYNHKILVEFEEGHFDEAEKLICRARRRKYTIDGCYDKYVQLIQGSIDKSDDWYDDDISRISILGPAPWEGHERDIEELISPGNINIRFNYLGTKKLGDIQKKIPTGASFYNLEVSRMLLQNECMECNTENVHVYLKDGVYEAAKKQSVFKTVRKYEDISNRLCFIGTANMLQTALFNIASHTAKTIYVYRNNLYLGNRYDKGYVAHVNDKLPSRSFSVHDIISNYGLLMHMYKAKLFIPDDELQTVLNYGIEEYVRLMELQNFGY